MRMKLKTIALTCENCETITISGKYVGAFMADSIETGFYRIASNSVKKRRTANRIVVELHKGANVEEHVFNCKELTKHRVFERLKQGDITHIDFAFEDGDGIKEYSFSANWCGESDYINEAQKAYESKCGHLYLVIEDGKDIEDYFSKEEINDASYVDFRFDMMDVG